jgi:hypothetical protein
MNVIRSIVRIVIALVCLAAFLAMQPASAQQLTMSVSPRVITWGGISWSNTTVAATSTNVYLSLGSATNLFLPMLRGHSLAGMVTCSSTASTNTAPWTNIFDLSLDGTNYSTTGAFTNVVNLNGTATVRQPFVFDLSVIDGFKAIRWTSCSGITGTSQVSMAVSLGITP